LLKLGALTAVGVFVVFGMFNGPADLLAQSAGTLPVRPLDLGVFATLALLGVLAMFSLPHQFHIGVVECRDGAHLKTARWLFPLYLVLISLPVLAFARAGSLLLGDRLPSDLYVLGLPLMEGQTGLALLTFLGGLSAATGMVILASLTLSIMIGNHWLAPLAMGRGWAERTDLRAAVLVQRRFGIGLVLLLAYGYSRALGGSEALADIGSLSFSGLAQLAPAVAFAVFLPRLSARAVLGGIVAGVLVWSYVLLAPLAARFGGLDPSWVTQGPLGMAWLSPEGLFGLHGWDRLSRGVAASLFANLAFTAFLVWLPERRPHRAAPTSRLAPDVLRDLAARFLGEERLTRLFESHGDAQDLEAAVEHELAAVVGAASARLLLDAARREAPAPLEAVAAIVGEASQQARFSQGLLEAALQNMSQGISVVDAELRLVAWNARYAGLFDYPPELLREGAPVEALLRHNLARMCHEPPAAYADPSVVARAAPSAGLDVVSTTPSPVFGPRRTPQRRLDALATDVHDTCGPARGLAGHVDVEVEVAKRLAHMREGSPYVAERRFPDGRVMEIRGNPMPGGGFVATFTDVTAFRAAEDALRQTLETLEQRVAERTAEAEQARASAEQANAAKSRFLAAVSHDLVQPLNAAHLFTHALQQQLKHAQYREPVRQIQGSLAATESLLAGLLDISRLDAGGLEPRISDFPLAELFEPLAAEFQALAGERGLDFHHVRSQAWVRSDPQLLRRILQNFLTNAVRYTEHGRILLGLRRRGDDLRLEVWDTGPGIAEQDRVAVFQEFRRLARGGDNPGLGLGLAIAERMARLLGHRIGLHSEPGRGTVFSVSVQRALPSAQRTATPRAASPSPHLSVLVIDNEPAVLAAMQALLEGWRCRVSGARGAAEALAQIAATRPDVALVDYHLDGDETGLDLIAALRKHLPELPAILITADHSEILAKAAAEAGVPLLHKPLSPLKLRALLARIRPGKVG
ncbi:MAG TPA: PAS domain-containing hybrid sensor histidine kinase/response regulator, partial [Xanthomonadaceae bacterium]|nr:PAS domain-containing hybrid sensor histidine kinase/response regulator [Xanthomonadaceae bacterium]